MKSIRWWPAAGILVLALIRLAYVWLSDQGQRQDQVVGTIVTVGLTLVGLLLWLLLLSRLPWRLRLGTFAVLLLALAAFRGLVKLKGVSGDWIPQLEWRFAAAPDPGAAAALEAEVPAAAALDGSPNDFPQFLGPERNARLSGPELARDWDARPPRLVWRKSVGPAWSGFAVVDGVAVTQEQRGEVETVVAYELASGRELWAAGHEARFETTIAGTGPRATPAIADGSVYAMGALGHLRALDFATGEVRWSRNVVEEHGSPLPQWGKAASPLLVDDLVVVTAGGEGRALVAYDRLTGEPRWQGGDDRSSYSSPLLAELAGVRQIVIFNAASVAGHDPADGRLLWQHPWPSENQPCVAQPLPLGGDRLLVSSGYGVGAGLLHIRSDGGGLTAEPLWNSLGMKAKFSQMVADDGYVYGLDDGILACLDPATGERCWKRGRYGHGQILWVDGLLLVQTEGGEVVLVEPDPEGLRELGRFEAVAGKAWNTLTLSGPLLLVRSEEEAACWTLPLAAAETPLP